MALNISIPTIYGVHAAYWNIASFQQNFRDKTAQVTLYGYPDKDARMAEANALSMIDMTIPSDGFTPDLTRAQLYDMIKKQEQFSTATDA